MWDERYSEPGFAYGEEPNSFLAQMAHFLPPGKILSLCEGEGRNAVFLAEHGYEVHAIDASAVGMQKAQQLANSRGVAISTAVGNLSDFHIEKNAWSGIVSIFCHVPADIRVRIHAEAVKGLVPGGVLLLEAYTPEQLSYGTGGPATAELTMQLQSLKEELDGLEILHAREEEREVIEGKYHTGMGHVVQLVARKPV